MGKKKKDKFGALYLIPTTLGDTAPLEVLPLLVKQVIEEVDYYIAENEKSARHFIKKISSRKSQPGLRIEVLNKFTEPGSIPSFLDPCLQGESVGILSEAGCPAIADPGSEVVRIAHEKNIKVIPLVGPSSLLLAMMASGLNGQNFCFNGYLPRETSELKRRIQKLERTSREQGLAQVFIETPYRNNKLLEELTRTLSGKTDLCVACDLTLPTEFIRTQPVSNWKDKLPDLHKRPSIFIIQA